MAGPRPVFNQINIVCSDTDASLAFYRRLGVAIPEGMVWRTATGAHHIGPIPGDATDTPSIDLDSATFARHWNRGWQDRADIAGRVVVGFGVATREEVDRLHADMTAAGYRSLQAPCDAFWGARYAVIEDPDGLAVGLMSPISAEHRVPPPEV
jgi:catechol 2,3-dioxygenase-like lactoylglutathione lyase family enzyme